MLFEPRAFVLKFDFERRQNSVEIRCYRTATDTAQARTSAVERDHQPAIERVSGRLSADSVRMRLKLARTAAQYLATRQHCAWNDDFLVIVQKGAAAKGREAQAETIKQGTAGRGEVLKRERKCEASGRVRRQKPMCSTRANQSDARARTDSQPPTPKLHTNNSV